MHASEKLGDGANDSDVLPVTAALLLLSHGLDCLRRGAMGEALEAMLAIRALDTDLGDHTVTALAVTVHLHLARGDVREASTAALELVNHADTAGREGGRAHVALGELAAALGDHYQAAAHYRTAGALAQEYDPEVPWRTGLAQVLVSTGLAAEAVAVAEEEQELALACGSPYAVAAARRTLAAVGPITDRIGLLRAALAALDGGSAQRLDAQLRTDLAGLLMLTPEVDTSEPVRLLRTAEAYALREDLWPLQSRAQRLLGRLGERPSDPALDAAHSLTGTERRVASLVVKGSRNKDVAVELGVSVKAIEWHLSRIYRKLTITSRGQLAAALGDSVVVPV